MEEGWESSGAVAAKSNVVSLALDLDLGCLREVDASASSDDESEAAEGEGEGARPDQSNPPDTFKADAGPDLSALDLDFVDLEEAVGGTSMSTWIVSLLRCGFL